MDDSHGPGRGGGSGNRKPAATIYDIARTAGVSPSTVSRALNKPGRINATTEKRIRSVADELGYRLNPMARALPTGRTGTIALILSDITNPVYFDLIRGAERVAANEGYTLVLAESQESPSTESETAERLWRSVDGLILVASRLDDDRIQELAEHKPLILVNRSTRGVPGIAPNPLPGIQQALDHLASLGHRTIAFLSGPAPSWMSRLRWETLLDEAPRRDMSIVEIGPGAPTLDGGRESFTRVKAAGVTAVMAYNDLMAIGLMQVCKTEGVDVPDELSIIGFDDIFGSSLTTPAVTTIRSPLGLLGETAIQNLITELDQQPMGPHAELLTEFVQRESTATPSARRRR